MIYMPGLLFVPGLKENVFADFLILARKTRMKLWVVGSGIILSENLQ